MATWNEVTLSELELKRIDAEFYKPDYIAAKKIAGEKRLKHYGVIVLHPAEFTRRYSDDGLHILLAQNNRDNSFDWSVKRFASRKLRGLISRNRLEFGDVTISRSGANYGQTSVIGIELENNEIFACADLLLLRTSAIDGHLLSTYFNSSVGKKLLDRGAYGAAQPHIAPNYIKEIPFPDFLVDHGEEIKDLVIQSRKCSKESETLYTQAQNLLESELCLDKLKFEKPVSYVTMLSELEKTRRSDAEFFHIKYKPFLSTVKAYQGGWSSLQQLTKRTLPNFNVEGHFSDYEYIEIGDINVCDGGYTSNRVHIKKLPANAKIILNGGEILISQVRPTRGAIAIIDDTLSHPTISSGAFYVCTVNDLYQRESIWLYLRSIRSVFEKYCGGTSYPTIESYYISKFPVPIFRKEVAIQIRQLVLESKAAKSEFQRLINLAKTRVEQLIEEAVRQ